MEIYTIVDNSFGENCYVVSDSNGVCAVIDPASSDVSDFILKRRLKPAAVLLTHGHFDHISGLDNFLMDFEVPVYIHENDAELLYDGNKNASLYFGFSEIISSVKPIVFKNCKFIINIGELEFTAIHTPGHTSGSVCYFCGKSVFSGDTLFADGYGRTDLYGGNAELLSASLIRIENSLKGKTIYPGHGNTKKF